MKLVTKSVLYGALLAAFSVNVDTARAQTEDCATRTNNTPEKLMECVTIDGVRAHQAAFQAAADANTGIRSAGTQGYLDSVLYVADTLEAAGYSVTMQPFLVTAFIVLSPSELAQIAPTPATYVNNVDFQEMTYTAAGDVTADVTAVDLQLGLGNASTSGCEAADFAGFPAGNIALLQRGVCTFQVKAENAAAAGAVGAIIFNQGNTNDRISVFGGTLSAAYGGGIPVFAASYTRGAEWATTPGLTLSMEADVSSSPVTTYNVIAETASGDPGRVLMVGAHLDSVPDGPGIQDNGSGSAAILEVAVQMAKVKPINKVRFAWWGAEENGLLGSNYYLSTLSAAERSAITGYLNFDMIGSPNYVRYVLDGDDAAAPAGSADIEAYFASFYGARSLPFAQTAIFFSTDTAAFITAGIPVGGVFTGASGVKTAQEAATYGGVAGVQYDPCYHLACDTFDNVNLDVLDLNADAVAASVLRFATVKIKKTKKPKSAKSAIDYDYYGHEVRK